MSVVNMKTRMYVEGVHEEDDLVVVGVAEDVVGVRQQLVQGPVPAAILRQAIKVRHGHRGCAHREPLHAFFPYFSMEIYC